MKLSTLQFAFGLSLLVHGGVISTVYVAGHGRTFARPIANQARNAIAFEVIVESEIPSATVPASAQAENAVPTSEPQNPPQEIVPETPSQVQVQQPESPIVALAAESPAAVSTAEPSPDPPSATPSADVSSVISTPDSGTAPQAGPDASSGVEYLFNPRPAYPAEARRHKQQGLVILAVLVAREGRSEKVEVLQSSGYTLLDESASRAVEQWRFIPAHAASAAVASRVEIPIRFKLTR